MFFQFILMNLKLSLNYIINLSSFNLSFLMLANFLLFMKHFWRYIHLELNHASLNLILVFFDHFLVCKNLDFILNDLWYHVHLLNLNSILAILFKSNDLLD